MADLLLIDSQKPLECPNPNTWCPAEAAQVSDFVNNIVTAKADADKPEKFRAMISGVPSPWARVTLTRKALAMSPKELGTSVIDNCYRFFRSEWRGLVSAFVLHPDSFEFSDPVFLRGDHPEDNGGKMNTLNAYGEMLFSDAPFWVLQNDKLHEKDNPASLQLLYFRKNESNGAKRLLVGATSPFTFLFTSMNYDLETFQSDVKRDIKWVRDGKFFDPLEKGHDLVSNDELYRLYSFLSTVKASVRHSQQEGKNSARFYEDFLIDLCEKNGIDRDVVGRYMTTFIGELDRWTAEIAQLAGIDEKKGVNIPVSTPRPLGPLSLLMPSDFTFYLSGNRLFAVKPDSDYVEINSGKIFYDSDYIAAWRNIEGDPNRDIDKAAVYYLKTDKGYHVALPFTDEMTAVFANDIGSMLSGDGSIRLTAMEGNDGSVEVRLEAKMEKDDWSPIARKSYQKELIAESDGKLFIWPNFRSPKWKRYYYYSEFPTNGTGVRMIPDFGENVSPEMLVKYPLNQVEASAHRYEIMRTNVPLKKVIVKLSKGGQEIMAGMLVVREDRMPLIDRALTKATVGIDFGSTNTCAYYKIDMDTHPRAVPFSNRRLALVGYDNPQLAMAMKDELFFISNEGTLAGNGQVKSWLHEHDPKYISRADLNKEIVGGIPVNESNITVLSMNEHTIQTNAGALHYNMKWLSEDDARSRKESYMKMLWIQICADLFAVSNAYPEKLYWSFPSSMGKADRISLEQMYDNIARETIIQDETKSYRPEDDRAVVSITESESVSVYSMVKGTQVSDQHLALGIDVGGSTSDILVMGEGRDLRAELFTQSSIRIAGGFFFKTVNSSPRFRQALYNFHESHSTPVRVLGIKDVIDSNPDYYQRAPYYLNNVFDQLKTDDDFYNFYNYLRLNVQQVFALPAYVTGMLVFYSGMLVRNVKEKKGLDLKDVSLRYYGKGGRLFDWLLRLYGRDSRRYYQRCFSAGYGDDSVVLTIDSSNNAEVKSEVAMGLVSDPETYLKIPVHQDEREIESFDVIGEEGVTFVDPNGEQVAMNPLDVIPEKMFFGAINVRISDEMTCFKRFLDIYLHFLSEDSGGILRDTTILQRGVADVKVRAFILNDIEFRKALKTVNQTPPTIYRMPIIVAEALNYLNDVLIPAVAEQMR